MEFKRIEKEIYKKGYTKKDFFEKTRIMTEQGFHYSVANKKLKVVDLEAISKALEIPMSIWWDDQPGEESKELEEVKQELAELKNQLRIAYKVQETMANQLEKKRENKGEKIS